MSTPTLSLLIPTYNRSALLAQALDAIGRQLHDGNVGDIEIVISDNGSPDDTSTIVADFCAVYLSAAVTYVRQESNRGSDRNICDVLKLARGTYLVLLSDDDILLPGAIDITLAHLRSSDNLTAICWIFTSFDISPGEAMTGVLPTMKAELVTSRDDAFIRLGTMITFISAMVFRRTSLDIARCEERIGTSFVLAYLNLGVLSSGSEFLFLQDPTLAIRSNNTGGYNFFEIFVTNFNDLLTYAKSLNFSPSATRKVLDSHRQFIRNFVLLFKVRGGFGSLVPDYSDGIRRLWQVYRHDPLFLISIIPIMLFPSPLIPAARRFIRFLRSLRSL